MKSKGTAKSEDWRRLQRFSLREQALAVLLGLILTGVAVWTSQSQMRQTAEARFANRTAGFLQQLRLRLETYEQVLKSGAALMNLSQPISRETWAAFVRDLSIDEHFRGIQGIGWSRAIRPGELAEHEVLMRARGFPDYHVRPVGPRDFYTAITFLEPLDWRNRRAIGYDMWTESVRRDAMLRSLRSGRAAMSGKVILAQEGEADVQPGFLMYLPVFDQRRLNQTPLASEQALRGWIFGPFRAHDLLNALIAEDWRQQLDIRVFSGTKVDEAAQLYGEGKLIRGHLGLFKEVQIPLYSTVWTLQFAPTREFVETLHPNTPLWIGLFGLVVTILLWLIVRSLAKSRAQALVLADQAGLIEAARAEAETANMAKSRFLAAASHDLRQPLQSLGIFLHLLAERGDEKQRALYAARAVDSFRATERLLNSLMDISSLETGMIQPDFQPISLRKLLARIVDEIRPEAEQRGLELRLCGCDVVAETDPVMVERMVRNLLSNALKYTKRGGVLLGCRSRRDAWWVEVWDTGNGIAEDRLEIIFEDFYQIDNPERDRSKGLGLGLSTFSRLARLLGYSTTVRSRLGKGSMFGFSIPKTPHPLNDRGAREWRGGG